MRPSQPSNTAQDSAKQTPGLKEHAAHQQMRSRLLRMILQNEENRKSQATPPAPPANK